MRNTSFSPRPRESAELAIDAPARMILGLNWPELLTLVVVLAAYAIAAAEAGPFLDFMNLAGPSVLMIALGYGCIAMIKRGIVAVWTLMFWVRVSLIAYCGVGSIVPWVVNEESRNLMEGFFQFFPSDVNKYNITVVMFIFSLITGACLVISALSLTRRGERLKETAQRMIEPSGLDLRTMGLTIFIIGAIASYLFLLPYQLGFVEGVIPQIIPQLSFALQISFFLLTYWSLKNRSQLFYIIIAISLVDSALGVLYFSKTLAVFPLVMTALGIVYHKPTIRRFVLLGTVIISFYFTITPVVAYARAVLANNYGEITGAPFSERISIINDYSPQAAEALDDRLQLGWIRLSYVNAGTFAINEYDQGRPGYSFDQALVVFIPRFLYPSKPIITQIGQEFNYAGTGNYYSASAPGWPADLYWSGGFTGVIVGGIFIGILFCAWSLYSITVMRTGAWHLLFLVLLGLRTGLEAGGFVVASILGPLTFAIVAHFALTLLNRLTLKRSRSSLATA